MNEINTQPIVENIVNQMGAFIGCALAKEARQRYMKPHRAFRAVQDGIQAINDVAINANMQANGFQINQFTGQPYQVPQAPVVEQPVVHQGPKPLTHKDMTKRFEHFERNFESRILGKIETLIRPPVVEEAK